MEAVRCVIYVQFNIIKVYRGKDLIASVVDEKDDGNPEMVVYGNGDNMQSFTFNDMDIIQDNWNQMQEMRKANEK